MGKNNENYIDWIGVVLLLCIGVFGVFILLTINPQLALQQVIYLLIGFFLLWLISRFDESIVIWMAPFGYIAGVFLLLITFIGPTIRGAKRWIEIAGVQFQPSEIAKPMFLLAFSWIIARFPPSKTRYVPIHIVLFFIPFFLIFRQPDLGTAIVYVCFWFAMMIAGGLRLGLVISTLIIGVIGMPLFWQALAEYQKNRILTFINPALDPQGAGYNAIQAMIAVGSGRLFGRGLGRGTQSHLQFLPEYHTDFIFATLVEELGFIGGSILLFVYAVLLWRVMMPMFSEHKIRSEFFIYSFGLLVMILVQIVVNTGMNMGIIPVTGITLPFVSFGGSSVFSIALSFGVLWALQKGVKS